MLYVGIKLSIIDSLLEILLENIRENGDKTTINAQNLLSITIKEFREIRKKFNKIERILNI